MSRWPNGKAPDYRMSTHLLFSPTMEILHNFLFNSLTAKSCYGGEKHRNPVGFYSRNSTKSTLQHKHNYHKHHHHGGAVCPSFGVGSMDPPDRTRVTSSEGVGRGGGRSE